MEQPATTAPRLVGVKGEIRSDLHRAVRKYMIDQSLSWDEVIAQALEEWAKARSIEQLYPALPK